jgi:hypothetical protein
MQISLVPVLSRAKISGAQEATVPPGIDKMRERRSQAPFEFLQAHFKILTF